MHKRLLPAAAGAVGVLAFALAACSSSSADSGATDGGGASAELRQVTIGLLPAVDVAPLMLGIEQGCFADEGIELNIEWAAGGAAVVPAVVSGDYEIGYGAAMSVIIANDKGFGLQIVAPGVTITEDQSQLGLITMPDSGIGSIADLAGKTVAVNTLNSVDHLALLNALEVNGIDADSVQVVEIGFPNQAPAVLDHQVDAAWTPEPFLTIALDGGAADVGNLYLADDDSFSSGYYFTSNSFADANAEIISGFQSAIVCSVDYANAHEDEVRDVVTTYTTIDPELVAKMTLPNWFPEIDVESVETQADQALRFGLISTPVDLDATVRR